MDIKSPTLLKLKGAMFFLIGVLSTGLLAASVYPLITRQVAVLFVTCIWGFCRAYYFCFYVMEHYADPNFKYAGLFDLFLYLTGMKRSGRPNREPTTRL